MQTVPPFSLTAETGTPFNSDLLRGQVWVADFIFTTCNGPCPRMTSQMRQVQDALTGVGHVKLVTFTVDPEHDTPEALAQYAKRQKADPNRWVFLTGSRETLHSLCREAFLLGNVDGNLNHSTRFVLVDRESRVRGYYDTSEASSIPKLIEDIRSL
jgi:protein SCO1/2